MSTLLYGDFVRVKSDAEFRAGQDGMVITPEDASGEAGLIFYYDRYGQTTYTRGSNGSWPTPCEGVEAWALGELDLTTIDRSEAA